MGQNDEGPMHLAVTKNARVLRCAQDDKRCGSK
jgi:hypothetical protein